MTFEQDMIAMNADQVHQAVLMRLRDGTGVFAPASRDEPVWAILQSAFRHWRGDNAKTKAVDAALHELLPAAFEQGQWRIAQDACEFAVVLASGSPPWIPSSAAQWPLEQWLHAPTSPPEKIDAAVAAIRLLLALSTASPVWVEQKFKEACAPENAMQLAGRRWVEECWKARLRKKETPSPADMWRLPLFQALAFARRCDDFARDRLLQSLIALAWLAFEPEHRVALNDAIVKAARDFEDGNFVELVLRITQQEFGDAYRATDLPKKVQGTKVSAQLRRVTVSDRDEPADAHRRSDLCPA